MLALTGCASTPQLPYSADDAALSVLAAQAGGTDRRGRFREIYCATLDARGHDIPDYRTCDDALTRVGTEPAGPRYYSLVTYPQPERISKILQSSYNKLARLDGRNDSQMIFNDQVIPGSTLLGFVNADHWALALPITRTHATVSELFVTQNAYPREALLEAVLRFVEEDLASNAR